MKVSIIQRYTDLQLNRRVMQGEVLEVDEKRALELVNATVGIIIKEEATEPILTVNTNTPTEPTLSSVKPPRVPKEPQAPKTAKVATKKSVKARGSVK